MAVRSCSVVMEKLLWAVSIICTSIIPGSVDGLTRGFSAFLDLSRPSVGLRKGRHGPLGSDRHSEGADHGLFDRDVVVGSHPQALVPGVAAEDQLGHFGQAGIEDGVQLVEAPNGGTTPGSQSVKMPTSSSVVARRTSVVVSPSVSLNVSQVNPASRWQYGQYEPVAGLDQHGLGDPTSRDMDAVRTAWSMTTPGCGEAPRTRRDGSADSRWCTSLVVLSSKKDGPSERNYRTAGENGTLMPKN